MRRRHELRLAARVRSGAALCQLTVTEWLALPRRERKRRLQAVRAEGGD